MKKSRSKLSKRMLKGRLNMVKKKSLPNTEAKSKLTERLKKS